MNKSSKYSIKVSGREVFFPREVAKVIDFHNTVVVQTKPKEGETNEDWFKIDSIFGVSKASGEIIWSRPGFEISKQKKESKILLLNQTDSLPIEYELQVYCVSMNFYINPDSGKTTRQEQTK